MWRREVVRARVQLWWPGAGKVRQVVALERLYSPSQTATGVRLFGVGWGALNSVWGAAVSLPRPPYAVSKARHGAKQHTFDLKSLKFIISAASSHTRHKM
jgi:hypothetical protein